MRINSMTSDHRWYLLMMPQSRLFLQLGEWMQIPGWLQVFVFATPCMIPKRTLKREQYLMRAPRLWAALEANRGGGHPLVHSRLSQIVVVGAGLDLKAPEKWLNYYDIMVDAGGHNNFSLKSMRVKWP